ncbi:MAG: gamma-glutamylcyclotransferase [Leptolyngbyaceae cyanobacterium SL_1_1]|nr:gamma-glutamylcyclotransferase [Leptolyngbyaceae cyanobacterium RM1_1_2]NJO11767.1 gamma-glutamylcyclotransferase [Leptolyngbyaceae cyanobacterium SL_1_1]
MLQVFVYGTLKPGEPYHDSYCGAAVLEAIAAITPGQLYHLPLGYPAMTVGAGWVSGVLLSLAQPEILQRLDQLEDFHSDRPPDKNEYQRLWRPVFAPDLTPLGDAWMYVMTAQKVSALSGKHLPAGVWSAADCQAV